MSPTRCACPRRVGDGPDHDLGIDVLAPAAAGAAQAP
jgi:hypothetical protein